MELRGYESVALVHGQDWQDTLTAAAQVRGVTVEVFAPDPASRDLPVKQVACAALAEECQARGFGVDKGAIHSALDRTLAGNGRIARIAIDGPDVYGASERFAAAFLKLRQQRSELVRAASGSR